MATFRRGWLSGVGLRSGKRLMGVLLLLSMMAMPLAEAQYGAESRCRFWSGFFRGFYVQIRARPAVGIRPDEPAAGPSNAHA